MLAYYLNDFDPFIIRLWGDIGPRWYGLAYVLAFGAAYWIYRWLAKRGYADLPLAQVSDLGDAAGKGVLRADVLVGSLDRAAVMAHAPETDQVFFKVPKVIER